MDIFILRDGKEIGPFGEETAQTLINQGTVDAEDLAWKPGMTNWIPLKTLLAVRRAPGAIPGENGIPPLPRKDGGASPENMPKEEPAAERQPQSSSSPAPESEISPENAAPAETQDKPGEMGEPATEKQKAFLSYLDIAVEENPTKERAAALLDDAAKNPALATRISQWNDDRLRLHPELFPADVQARKENRANHFLDVCHTEGAEYFSKVTKAHCRVVVTFLDGKFPSWDAHMKDAAKGYFFPAIIEKFPQLVEPQWRDLFHYSDASTSSPDGSPRPLTRRMKPRQPVTPLVAILRGVVAGFVILGALYLGQRFVFPKFAHPPAEKPEAADVEPSASAPSPPASSPAPATAAAAVASATPDSNLTKKEKKKLAKAEATAATAAKIAAAATPAPLAKNDAPAIPAPPSKTAVDPSMTTAPMTPEATLPAPAAPTATLATAASASATPAPASAPTPDATPIATAPATAATATPDPAAPAPKTNLVLTKPIELQLTYGKVKLPPGTAVKLVSRDGATVKLNYLNNIIVVPASATDIDSGAPAPPVASPTPSAPPAPAPN